MHSSDFLMHWFAASYLTKSRRRTTTTIVIDFLVWDSIEGRDNKATFSNSLINFVSKKI